MKCRNYIELPIIQRKKKKRILLFTWKKEEKLSLNKI
jgi:hypothetical protein